MASPRPAPDGSDTFFLGPAPDGPPPPLDARDPRNHNLFLLSGGRDGSRPPEARPGDGCADGVREHGDRRPRLQRDRREDARRPAARRAAAHDVHGRLPAGSLRQPPRPPLRGVVLHARGRGRRRRRRRSLHAPAGRRLLDRHRLRARVLRDAGAARAVARDVGARAAAAPLVPARARLGLPRRASRRPTPASASA